MSSRKPLLERRGIAIHAQGLAACAPCMSVLHVNQLQLLQGTCVAHVHLSYVIT